MPEFHISRRARDRYQFDQSLFSLNGNVILANFYAARVFAQKINQKKDLLNFPENAVRASQINAMGLIDEILHLVLSLYRQKINPQIMDGALAWLESQIGRERLDQTLLHFTREFPPLAVYRHELTPQEFLTGNTDGMTNRALALEEILLLWVENQNLALIPYEDLFDDHSLVENSAYPQIIAGLQQFFATQPPFGPDRLPAVELLRSPAVAVPYSLPGQLDYIRTRWADLLGSYLFRLLSSLDFLNEEAKPGFLGPGPVQIPVYGAGSALEAERFSQDQEWMPRLVLMAKNTLVWLDQLSRKYAHTISRLDQIPDEELDILAGWGFTGLWLIGLWQRSQASARIKQLCGNPDAVSSAYSLAGYTIAPEIGGPEAFLNLRERAARRGIRLASDMVPNHMGIDSSWVVEHPDWFISVNNSPFPSYTFNGTDLSNDSQVGIFIEDHFYDRSDAAVVFKRLDRRSGDVRYIYHGNDGTSMPWNDTAQLDYLNPAVREAVIQTILQVARQFPIIRFDAAMTLAKRHFQRLWFPEPGSGGDIPSRAEHSLPRSQFDAAMPVEFWREVVDRVAVEAPDTLLLAEAFWLMEGYFVRTLGMHRVYNSAFMNLLRNEDNQKYREVMKNTLEFDPEILKRFVNFMNNPDERTAVDQFGKGDKYIGICILLATMPGLPMFGHGQIEGFTEKYGMEFRRAYWDEKPNLELVANHERLIFPLMHRRRLFSGVENFLLYDFYLPTGQVDENVFAYSNGEGGEHSLVVFHNRFANTLGWVRQSSAYSARQKDGGRRTLQRTLGEGLQLTPGENRYLLFRDHVTGLEYIRPVDEVIARGLFFELNAYKAQVFLDFRQVQDDPYRTLQRLNTFLNGRGVPDLAAAQKALLLQPVQQPFREIANRGYLDYLVQNLITARRAQLPQGLLDEANGKLAALLDGISSITGQGQAREEIIAENRRLLEAVMRLNLAPGTDTSLPDEWAHTLNRIRSGLSQHPNRWTILFSWVFLHDLGKTISTGDPSNILLGWMEEWQLNKLLADAFNQFGLDEGATRRAIATVKILITYQGWFQQATGTTVSPPLKGWLEDAELQAFLGINRYRDILWFNKESFEEFLWWMSLLATLPALPKPSNTRDEVQRAVFATKSLQQIEKAAADASYQVSRLLEIQGT